MLAGIRSVWLSSEAGCVRNRLAVGRPRVRAGQSRWLPIVFCLTLPCVSRRFCQAIPTPHGRASAPRRWCSGCKPPRCCLTARRGRRVGWGPCRAKGVRRICGSSRWRVRRSVSMEGGWDCRAGSGRRSRSPSSANAHPLKRKSATAGWQGIAARVRANRPVRPLWWCPWPLAKALARRGWWTRGAGSHPDGQRGAAALRVIGAAHRGPRSGMDGPRGSPRPPWGHFLWHAPANRTGRPARAPAR